LSLYFFHTFPKRFNVNHKCLGEDNAHGKKAFLKMRRLYLNLLGDLRIIVIIAISFKSNHRCHSIITIIVFVFKQEDISIEDVCTNVNVHHIHYAAGHLL
jgi:hypothetical protein